MQRREAKNEIFVTKLPGRGTWKSRRQIRGVRLCIHTAWSLYRHSIPTAASRSSKAASKPFRKRRQKDAKYSEQKMAASSLAAALSSFFLTIKSSLIFFFLSLSLSLFFSPVPYREHGAAGVRRFRDDLESDNRAAPAEIGRTKKRGDEDGKKSKADIRSRNKKKKVKKTH